MTSFHYSLGPDPYNSQYLYQWGQFKGRYPCRDVALRALFMGHPFPAILTGRFRGVFVPGVSLDGVIDEEVVQVWTDDPKALANIKEYKSKYPDAQPDHWPHIGDGTCVGLLEEIHVSKIADYQVPEIAGLLTDGSGMPMGASPAGRMALSFTPRNRSAVQLRFMQGQLAGIGTSMRMSDAMEEMGGKLAQFKEGMGLMTAYCNGTNHLEALLHGDRAPASEPYSIFQSRLYLEEEIGLIANMLDIDHRDMKRLDEWLVRKSRWKKLMPLAKCILVTRICRKEKSYDRQMGAIEAAYHNHFNMETLVWIRDGENLWRFSTDIQFEERVFPAGDDVPEIVTLIQEHIWKRHWATADKSDSFRSSFHHKDGEKPKNPAEEAEPVYVLWKDSIKFATLQGFLDSEQYTPELDVHIRKSALESSRARQRAMMPFALLLQGIIDTKGLLSIPPGTDIFDPDTNARYLRLINDFSNGITDSRNHVQFDTLTKIEALKPGDRIFGWLFGLYKEKWEHEAKWNTGTRGAGPFLFTVHHTDPEAKGHYTKLFVHEFERSKRWVYNSGPLKKTMSSASIDGREWIPADFPQSLATALLDDREWKRSHLWAVPILARWKFIQSQFPQGPSGPVPLKIKLTEQEEAE